MKIFKKFIKNRESVLYETFYSSFETIYFILFTISIKSDKKICILRKFEIDHNFCVDILYRYYKFYFDILVVEK